MLSGFKQFILRGNVIDLAVGVVIGGAFGTIVTALVKDIITPFIGVLGHQPDFSSFTVSVNGSEFLIGDFINAIISFLIIALAVYFFIVLPVNSFLSRMKQGKVPPDFHTKKCPECLSDIPKEARRCAHCTAVLP